MKKAYLILVGLLGAHLFFLVNLQFTAWPEMLSYPWLRHNGFLLYRDMIHPYPPILTMVLSYYYSVFGFGLLSIKLFTWSLILVNDVLIFLIVSKLTGRKLLAISSVFFCVLLQPFLEGNQLWFDLAIIPPTLLATYYLLQKSTNRNIFLAGLFFGIAALIKQTAGLYLVLSIMYLVLSRKTNLKSLLYFVVGPLILGSLLIIRLITEGALLDFVNWVIVYPFTFWHKFPGYVEMNVSLRQIFVIVLLFAPFGFLIARSGKKLFEDSKFVLLFALLFSSLLTVFPRFSYLDLQPALAFAAIIFGLLLSKIKVNHSFLATYYLLLIFVVILPILRQDWHREARFYSSTDLKLAEQISSQVKKDEKVFLLGVHSGLYAISKRVPPKRWTDNFGWYLEIPGVQEEIIVKWENNPPKIVYWREPSEGNWFDLGTYQPSQITDWIKNNYTKEQEVERGIWLWQKRN